MKALDLKGSIFVDTQDEIEIKEVAEMENIEGLGPVEVTRRVFSHRVTQLDKDLKEICSKYKVTEEQIAEVNKGPIDAKIFEELKANQGEILIPYTGQSFVYRSIDFKAEALQKDSRKMIEKMMAKTMRDITKRYKKVIQQAGLQDKKSNQPDDFSFQAKFYLEQHEYNYKKAIESFKADLKREIEVYNENKYLAKYLRPKKATKKDCVIF